MSKTLKVQVPRLNYSHFSPTLALTWLCQHNNFNNKHRVNVNTEVSDAEHKFRIITLGKSWESCDLVHADPRWQEHVTVTKKPFPFTLTHLHTLHVCSHPWTELSLQADLRHDFSCPSNQQKTSPRTFSALWSDPLHDTLLSLSWEMVLSRQYAEKFWWCTAAFKQLTKVRRKHARLLHTSCHPHICNVLWWATSKHWLVFNGHIRKRLGTTKTNILHYLTNYLIGSFILEISFMFSQIPIFVWHLRSFLFVCFFWHKSNSILCSHSKNQQFVSGNKQMMATKRCVSCLQYNRCICRCEEKCF